MGEAFTGAGILIRYHPNSGWSKLICPFLDYDSREDDQLLQFERLSFSFKEIRLQREREREKKKKDTK